MPNSQTFDGQKLLHVKVGKLITIDTCSFYLQWPLIPSYPSLVSSWVKHSLLLVKVTYNKIQKSMLVRVSRISLLTTYNSYSNCYRVVLLISSPCGVSLSFKYTVLIRARLVSKRGLSTRYLAFLTKHWRR